VDNSNIILTEQEIKDMIDLSLSIKDKVMFEEYSNKLKEYNENKTIIFQNGSSIKCINANENIKNENAKLVIYDNYDCEELTAIAEHPMSDGFVGVLREDNTIGTPKNKDELSKYTLVTVYCLDEDLNIEAGDTVAYDYLDDLETAIYKSYYNGLFNGVEIANDYNDKVIYKQVGEIEKLREGNSILQDKLIKQMEKVRRLENKIKKLENRINKLNNDK